MPLPSPESPPCRATWDVFCRVVDNHGDVGVCWRLAADLASRGIAVRLWVDDARALAWMAPTGRRGVDVRPWPTTDADVSTAAGPVAEVVVETFGCGLPEPCLQAMARRQAASTAPLWINLEYLTAESYAERSHRLPSPCSQGPARGLTTWFFYPGFTPGSGGLLREADLLQRQVAFDRTGWLADHDIAPRSGERLVSLFCYANANLPDLLRTLERQPTLLLTTPGHATEQVARALAEAGGPDRLRSHALPWLTQTDYDHLLWSCDLNFVRGEDSLVRAIWAGRPFIWQIYPQHDGAHAVKWAAFHSRHFGADEIGVTAAVGRLSRCWNGLERPVAAAMNGPGAKANDPWSVLNSASAMAAWAARCAAWRTELQAQPDLVTRLLAFVADRQAARQAKI